LPASLEEHNSSVSTHEFNVGLIAGSQHGVSVIDDVKVAAERNKQIRYAARIFVNYLIDELIRLFQSPALAVFKQFDGAMIICSRKVQDLCDGVSD